MIGNKNIDDSGVIHLKYCCKKIEIDLSETSVSEKYQKELKEWLSCEYKLHQSIILGNHNTTKHLLKNEKYQIQINQNATINEVLFCFHLENSINIWNEIGKGNTTLFCSEIQQWCWNHQIVVIIGCQSKSKDQFIWWCKSVWYGLSC